MTKPPRRSGKPKPPGVPAAKAALPDADALRACAAGLSKGQRLDAVDRAQQVIYDAWDQSTARSEAAYARKALLVCPLCADAFNLLAEQAKSPDQERELYQLALLAGELALGAEGFKEYAGHFWGFLETRPYMRARAGLAMTLRNLGQHDASIAHFRAMLELNPNDNQGIRYLLLAELLREEDIAGVRALLGDYSEEYGTQWLYTRLLLAFRDGRAAARETSRLLADARESNAHVAAILSDRKPRVVRPDGLVTVGGADEASHYVIDFGAAWRATPGAVAWLADAMDLRGESPPVRAGRPRRASNENGQDR